MRIFNKFIESKKEPSNKNDIWFDGSVFRIYKEEEWQAFTVNLNDANEIAKLKDELYEFLYDEAKPTVEEVKQAAATIQEYVDKAINALVLAQQSLVNSENAITEATALKSQTEQLIEQGNIVVENANKATDNANETSSNIKAIWDDLFVEINNSIASANEAASNANTVAETIDSKITQKVEPILNLLNTLPFFYLNEDYTKIIKGEAVRTEEFIRDVSGHNYLISYYGDMYYINDGLNIVAIIPSTISYIELETSRWYISNSSFKYDEESNKYESSGFYGFIPVRLLLDGTGSFSDVLFPHSGGHNMILKTEQELTEEEKAQVKKNLDIKDAEPYDDTALKKALEDKVDKVDGLGLSEENYTYEEKEKLAGLENYNDTALKEQLTELSEEVVHIKGGENALSVMWQELSNSRTWCFNLNLDDIDNIIKVAWSDNEYTLKAKGLNADGSESGYGADDWYWLDGTPHTGLDVKDKVDGYLSFNSADILAAYPNTTKLQVVARVGTSHNSITSDDCNNTYDIEKLSFKSAKMYNDIIVKVGKNGDFTSISAALTYLSQYYPLYKYGGVNAEIRILSGTIINEQILVVGADYSWITITYEDYQPNALVYDEVAEKIAKGEILYDTTSGYNSVKVDASKWSRNGITHDTRGDLCLFRAEDGGRLPSIGCVFKLQVENAYGVAGICCNRGSSCVVKTLCGFIGFKDGVISNNESSITIREGITMNCARWGCHARHNGEVSARSVIAVGCASNPAFASEYAALCSNRIADLDGREAWVSAGTIAFRIEHCSRMNCNGTNIIGDETTTIYATAAAVGNFYEMACTCPIAINYSLGSSLVLGTYDIEGSYTYNAVSKNGILYR